MTISTLGDSRHRFTVALAAGLALAAVLIASNQSAPVRRRLRPA
jgi:hypothetical protein